MIVGLCIVYAFIVKNVLVYSNGSSHNCDNVAIVKA